MKLHVYVGSQNVFEVPIGHGLSLSPFQVCWDWVFAWSRKGRKVLFSWFVLSVHVAVAWSLCDSNAIRYVNGANEPESKTTRMLCPVLQVAVLGAKSAVPDCILFASVLSVLSKALFQRLITNIHIPSIFPHVRSNSSNFLYMLSVAMARLASNDYAVHYVGLLLVLWMTSCFHIMKPMGQNQSDDVMFGRDPMWRHQSAARLVFLKRPKILKVKRWCKIVFCYRIRHQFYDDMPPNTRRTARCIASKW